ncbi:cobyrinic acid a,c-diamide synthase [Thiocystis violacea]|uniref:cobyrinic acid a,c-diamide synthase n=1 Tax=Thiocystis violacea TaxID=13725 RepID=UPI0019086B1F|nr:cobyrinic acid a,c-diamide synthase [Thiocystis violacea]MBK1719298.1 cobyrinic acid a,c-diamide synthase [Thiocystis violacea]
MFGFLQGLAYGLFLSCLPWLLIGMIDPRLVLPTETPTRFRVLIRYWLIVPFIAGLIWVTSLWGGFGPTLSGWLAGLAAIPVAIPVERAWRRWRLALAERQRAAHQAALAMQARIALEREARERGIAVLDPERPPLESDEVILGLWEAKKRLLAAGRPDLAIQADRLYTRHGHVDAVLRGKFDPRELTLERSRGLVGEVSRTALDNLNAMASIARGVAGVDADYVRRRLAQERTGMPAEERLALTRRLDLVAETEQRLRELSARNEAAITALDDAAVAVASVETDRPQASVAADQALADLRRFAEKAHHYGRDA